MDIIRTIWTGSVIPDHKTSNEVLTEPGMSSSIQELFERAARGESLGGSYDEFEDDSEFDIIHDPDYQDPLLIKSELLSTNERINDAVTEISTRKKKQSKANIEGSSNSKEGESNKQGSDSTVNEGNEAG